MIISVGLKELTILKMTIYCESFIYISKLYVPFKKKFTWKTLKTLRAVKIELPQKISSVAQSWLTLRHHGLHHTRLPCPSPTTRAYLNSCPLSQWCHKTISSSVVPCSSQIQYFPASGSFKMIEFFTSGAQTIRVSASASGLSMNIQDWFPLFL